MEETYFFQDGLNRGLIRFLPSGGRNLTTLTTWKAVDMTTCDIANVALASVSYQWMWLTVSDCIFIRKTVNVCQCNNALHRLWKSVINFQGSFLYVKVNLMQHTISNHQVNSKLVDVLGLCCITDVSGYIKMEQRRSGIKHFHCIYIWLNIFATNKLPS